MALLLDKAYLTAIWLETLFYGINLSLFVSFLFVVKYKRQGRPLHPLLFCTTILMFLLATIHVSMGFQRLIRGFITLRDQPGGPAAFFSDVSVPANVAKVTIHTINSILGDSVLVWRCYHVWGGNWLVVIWPILLILGSAVSGFGQSYIFAHAKTIHTAFNTLIERWNGAVFSLALCTNVVVTTLIAGRIWYLSREFATFNRSSAMKYRRILLIILESGAVYSSAIIIEITLYFLNNEAFYIVYDPIGQLSVIVPMTIIVLTSLGMASGDMTSQGTKRPSHTAKSTVPQFNAGTGPSQNSTVPVFSTAMPQDSTDLSPSLVTSSAHRSDYDAEKDAPYY